VSLSENDKRALLQVVTDAITLAATKRAQLKLDLERFSPALKELRSCFVSLHRFGELRGCIGSIEPRHPLIEDAAHNGYAVALKDYRFPPLMKAELPGLDVHVTVLSALEKIQCSSEADLLAKLRPNVDGLLIQDGNHQATFLPVMWEQLPAPQDFLQHLKEKAGMSFQHWSDSFCAFRYEATDELKTKIV
jgi:uncharacterized protein